MKLGSVAKITVDGIDLSDIVLDLTRKTRRKIKKAKKVTPPKPKPVSKPAAPVSSKPAAPAVVSSEPTLSDVAEILQSVIDAQVGSLKAEVETLREENKALKAQIDRVRKAFL